MPSEIPSFQSLSPSKDLIQSLENVRNQIDKSNPDWPFRVLVSLVDEKQRLIHSAMVGYGCKAVAQAINQSGKAEVNDGLVFRAGILHDVGQFGKTLGRTPWHELKGAVTLKSLGLDEEAKIVSRHASPIEGLTHEGKEVPEWLTLPQTLEDKILAVVDFSVKQGGEIVNLDSRLADIYQRFPLDGKNPSGKITKQSEERFREMFKEINSLTNGQLMNILKQVHQERIGEIQAKISN